MSDCQKIDPVKIAAMAVADGETYHGTGLMVTKIWSVVRQSTSRQSALISGRGMRMTMLVRPGRSDKEW